MPLAAAAARWLLAERDELQRRLNELENGVVQTGERRTGCDQWLDTTQRSIIELRGRLAAIQTTLPKDGI
jgi:uncharacterized coiled-coil DUF342 family protein